MDIAKIFWSGRSQAVRLPRDFRFEGDEVRIRRQGRAVILEPLPRDWSWMDELSGRVDEDFAEAALARPLDAQHRPELGELDAPERRTP